MPIYRRDDRDRQKLTRCNIELHLSEEIGSGTFGKVFKVSRADEVFAVKKFTYSATDPLHVTTLREIKALRTIKSRYVLRLERIIVNQYVIHLKVPFYEYDLYGLIGAENFSLNEIRSIFWQILKGVEAVHEHGYLHRDIKSANILLNRRQRRDDPRYAGAEASSGVEYEVCICDFGMARTQGKEMSPGVVTLWYRPPELLLGSHTYTKAVDIWSLGCILLEFFNKKPIFKANTEVEELCMIIDLCGSINEETLPGCTEMPLFGMYKLKEGKRVLMDQFGVKCLDAADLADRMLTLDPEKRPTAQECLAHPFFSKRGGYSPFYN